MREIRLREILIRLRKKHFRLREFKKCEGETFKQMFCQILLQLFFFLLKLF